jgi:Zn-dependent protease
MESFNLIQKIAIWVLPVLFAITVHEVSHGWMASKLGDKTALMLGRLTLNPVKHIDILGTIIIPIVLLILGGFIFGWAKPVPVTWQNLRHPKRDMALVALAGPVSNLLMALFWAGIAKVGLMMGQANYPGALGINLMGQAGIMINLVLMILNLIPIPPLDGSRVVSSLLPKRLEFAYNRLERFGFVILLLLIAFNVLSYLIAPPTIYLQNLLVNLFKL